MQNFKAFRFIAQRRNRQLHATADHRAILSTYPYHTSHNGVWFEQVNWELQLVF